MGPWEKTSLRRLAWTCMVSGKPKPSTTPRMELARLIGLKGKRRTRSGSPIVMRKTHLHITPSRSQMSIGNAMRRQSPNMGFERALVALFRVKAAHMTRHDRHPRTCFFISQDAPVIIRLTLYPAPRRPRSHSQWLAACCLCPHVLQINRRTSLVTQLPNGCSATPLHCHMWQSSIKGAPIFSAVQSVWHCNHRTDVEA